MTSKPARVNLIGLFDQKLRNLIIFPHHRIGKFVHKPDARLTFTGTASALKLLFPQKIDGNVARRARSRPLQYEPACTRKLFQEKHETADGRTETSRIRRCCWGNPCADHALHTSPSVTRYSSQLRHWIMSRQHKPCERTRITYSDHRGFPVNRWNSIETKRFSGLARRVQKSRVAVLMDEKTLCTSCFQVSRYG